MIIRAKKTNNYSVISNVGIRDERLSLRARGLYAFILTKPDDWQITVKGLYSELVEGRDAIRVTLMELRTAGYITSEPTRKGSGEFSNDLVLNEKPLLKSRTVTEKPTRSKASTVTGLPTRLTRPGNPTQLSTSVSTIDKSISANAPTDDLKTTPPNPIKQKQPTEKKVPNLDVTAVLDLWQEKYGKLTQVALQRRYAHLIIQARGADNALKLVALVEKTKGQQFAPVITDIKQLYYKQGSLIEYLQRQKQQGGATTAPVKAVSQEEIAQWNEQAK
jgi:hypothetical protein